MTISHESSHVAAHGGRAASGEVSPEQARDAIAAPGAACLLDVRSGVEFDTEQVPGSLHIPLHDLESELETLRARCADGPVLVLCKTGVRAARAREVLGGLGLGDVAVVRGGIDAWRAAGCGTVQGAPRMSLERQVRIGAGSLGLTGVLLGAFVHPGFYALAGFVSAGLVFAGVTDWCGMGLLLMRMPWNRARS